MKNLKKKFENETKTRINIINFLADSKSELEKILIKREIFETIDLINFSCSNFFQTEILCSSPRNNVINVYMDIREQEAIIKELKENILKSLYEACDSFEYQETGCIDKIKGDFNFMEAFVRKIDYYSEMSLSKFYEVSNTKNIFNDININELLNEIKQINYKNEICEDNDQLLWKKYFNKFELNLKKQYFKWVNRISKYYAVGEDGHEYNNEKTESLNYFNKEFENLCGFLYGKSSSCALMIDRVYMEIPSSNEQFTGIVFIEGIKKNKNRNLAKIIEKRISEDYKELFLVIANSNEDLRYFLKLKNNIYSLTLKKRFFCILNELHSFKEICKENNGEESLIDDLLLNVSKQIGIGRDRIIVTKEFNDIDKNSLVIKDSINDFIGLLKLMRRESESIGKTIKIKPLKHDKIINISLNQERMSVQALMGMLYERYHGYLVELWNKIINIEENNENGGKKYCYSKIKNIIRNRKDDYRDYKHILLESKTDNSSQIIDFSLRSGDCNDSKKILKMLLNYGYNTVGFNSNENKIIVNVDGEISKEDKDKLIKSIQGRLEESGIDYFENAFLMEVTRKMFNISSLRKALEVEKNITIDDFYSAFKVIFKKMSDNIIRYEVYLQ